MLIESLRDATLMPKRYFEYIINEHKLRSAYN